MKREDGMVYPRPLIRTRQGSARLMNVAIVVTLTAIAIASAKVTERARMYVFGLVLYVILNSVSTFRVLDALKTLELRAESPDKTMIALFDHSIHLTVLALMVVLIAVTLATM